MMDTAGAAWSPRYVGVIESVRCDPVPNDDVHDFARFVWNFLAGATSAGPTTLANGGTFFCCTGWHH